ncbi:MAG: hypothetical protein ACI8UO_000082 [Verrucomicrobiales bacterium]|jgi:hypothetical protein
MKTFTFFTTLAIAVAFGIHPAAAEDDAEANFVAMLKNATLKGTWAPVAQGQQGEDKNDAYQVLRAEKVEGDNWHIVTEVSRQGQTFEYPLPVIVKFAGDTAVMILDDARTGDGGKWSARVLFHNNVYAGSWWSAGGKAGTISGTISQKE